MSEKKSTGGVVLIVCLVTVPIIGLVGLCVCGSIVPFWKMGLTTPMMAPQMVYEDYPAEAYADPMDPTMAGEMAQSASEKSLQTLRIVVRAEDNIELEGESVDLDTLVEKISAAALTATEEKGAALHIRLECAEDCPYSLVAKLTNVCVNAGAKHYEVATLK